jgi:hypothetical protein
MTVRDLLSGLVAVLVLTGAFVAPAIADDVRDLDHIVFAALNTTGQEGVVESSITFLANVNMDTILKHMLDQGTLSKIAPDHIKVTKVEKTKETEDSIEYAVEEELKPMMKIPFVTTKMDTQKVHLIFTVNKRALKDRTVAVKYDLDPTKPNGWEVLSGRIYAADLRNGHTMVMLASSTKSKYGMPATIRLKLAKLYLEKTKKQVLNWLNTLHEGK